MNQLIEWFARNRVAANMLMITIICLGVLFIQKTQKEIFPPLERDKINITASMPGASPTQIEQSICAPIERAIISIPDINRINSTSSSNSCYVVLELEFDSDIGDILEQTRTKVSALSLPPTASHPQITRSIQEQMISRLSLVGNVDYVDLRKAAEKVQSDLTALGLSQVLLRDAKDYQIYIEISERKLQQYKISLAEISRAVQENAFSIGTGHIASGQGTASVVVSGKYDNIDDIAKTVIRSLPDGGQLLLSDIASIQDEFSDGNMISRIDGKPALSVSVYQEKHRSIIEISEIVNNYLKKVQGTLPEGIDIIHIQDNSAFFTNRIRLLVENAILGFILVFLTLVLFLHVRLAFWVSMGIVIAFIGGFIILYLTGNSINMLSTFGLVLVLGVVVDDAIIIAENIDTHQQNGRPGVEGAVSGTLELALPVICAVITSAITFVPLFFLPSAIGVLMAQIPIIVIATLLFSLMECLFILPAHLVSHNHQPQKAPPAWKLTNKLNLWVEKYYRPALAMTLKWRYASIISFMGIFFISLSLIFSGWVKIDYFAAIEAEVATGHVSFPQGTDFEKTREAVKRIEKAAIELKEELYLEYGSDQILHTRTLVYSNANAGDVFLSLATSQDRKIAASEVMARWQAKAGEFPEAYASSFNSKFELDNPSFNIRLFSADHEQLKAAANALKLHLENYPGVYNIGDSFNTSHQEIKVNLKEGAFDLGLDIKNLSTQISQSFMGITLPSLQRGTYNTSVILRLPEDERNAIWHLENLPIRLSNGDIVPLYAVAYITYESSPSSIQHVDGQRVVYVSAQLDEKLINGTLLNQQVSEHFINKLQFIYPDVTSRPSAIIEIENQVKERVSLGFWLSLLFIFMLMAMLLGSYFQPAMIMSAVPFGLIGALLGHLLFGESLTIFSICGMVAVSGIVINDNMVLVFYINEQLKKGVDLVDAIKEAGVARFRPIFLTTATTFVGLSPIMLEGSWEAQFLIPMALSIAFGVAFATLISLFLVPALYLASYDVRLWADKKIAWIKKKIKLV